MQSTILAAILDPTRQHLAWLDQVADDLDAKEKERGKRMTSPCMDHTMAFLQDIGLPVTEQTSVKDCMSDVKELLAAKALTPSEHAKAASIVKEWEKYLNVIYILNLREIRFAGMIFKDSFDRTVHGITFDNLTSHRLWTNHSVDTISRTGLVLCHFSGKRPADAISEGDQENKERPAKRQRTEYKQAQAPKPERLEQIINSTLQAAQIDANVFVMDQVAREFQALQQTLDDILSRTPRARDLIQFMGIAPAVELRETTATECKLDIQPDLDDLKDICCKYVEYVVACHLVSFATRHCDFMNFCSRPLVMLSKWFAGMGFHSVLDAHTKIEQTIDTAETRHVMGAFKQNKHRDALNQALAKRKQRLETWTTQTMSLEAKNIVEQTQHVHEMERTALERMMPDMASKSMATFVEGKSKQQALMDQFVKLLGQARQSNTCRPITGAPFLKKGTKN